MTQQNNLALKAVVFTNSTVTLGASLPFNTITPTPGRVLLCKHPGATGTFNFNVAVAGAVATDQILSTVSLTANTCNVIFVRASTIVGGAALIKVVEASADSLQNRVIQEHLSRRHAVLYDCCRESDSK